MTDGGGVTAMSTFPDDDIMVDLRLRLRLDLQTPLVRLNTAGFDRRHFRDYEFVGFGVEIDARGPVPKTGMVFHGEGPHGDSRVLLVFGAMRPIGVDAYAWLSWSADGAVLGRGTCYSSGGLIGAADRRRVDRGLEWLDRLPQAGRNPGRNWSPAGLQAELERLQVDRSWRRGVSQDRLARALGLTQSGFRHYLSDPDYGLNWQSLRSWFLGHDGRPW